MSDFDPHVTYCPRCVYPSGSRVVAVVVYLGGWLRVERCDFCQWFRWVNA